MNWLKSLSFSSQQTQHTAPQRSTNRHQNIGRTSPAAQPQPPPLLPIRHAAPKTAPANTTTRAQQRPDKTMHVGGVHSMSASTSATPLLMPNDIIDPASPLSILAAASKLTTFPYGELQAVNARVHLETAPKLAVNGVSRPSNPSAELNGVLTLKQSSPVAGVSVPHTPLVVEQRQKLRSQDRISSIAPVQPLLPPSMPHPPRPPPTATASNQTAAEIEGAFVGGRVPDAPISPITAGSQRSLRKQRNVIASALLPKTRSKHVSQERSTSLSSTLITRTSKRLKTSHDTPGSEPIATTTTFPFDPTPEPGSTPPPAHKRRLLPARQGHIDILEGEISLLSTPQRLDSTHPSLHSS